MLSVSYTNTTKFITQRFKKINPRFISVADTMFSRERWHSWQFPIPRRPRGFSIHSTEYPKREICEKNMRMKEIVEWCVYILSFNISASEFIFPRNLWKTRPTSKRPKKFFFSRYAGARETPSPINVILLITSSRNKLRVVGLNGYYFHNI